MDADGLIALDELPIGLFGGDSDSDLSAVFPGGAGQQATACDVLLQSPRYDAVPALLALGSTQHSEEEIAGMCGCAALVDMLLVASQLARNSERYYGMLSRVFTAEKLVWILLMKNALVRSKCCNLIGNLCRYVLLLLVLVS